MSLNGGDVLEVVIVARSVDGERRWARTGTAPLGSLELLRAAATAGATTGNLSSTKRRGSKPLNSQRLGARANIQIGASTSDQAFTAAAFADGLCTFATVLIAVASAGMSAVCASQSTNWSWRPCASASGVAT